MTDKEDQSNQQPTAKFNAENTLTGEQLLRRWDASCLSIALERGLKPFSRNGMEVLNRDTLPMKVYTEEEAYQIFRRGRLKFLDAWKAMSPGVGGGPPPTKEQEEHMRKIAEGEAEPDSEDEKRLREEARQFCARQVSMPNIDKDQEAISFTLPQEEAEKAEWVAEVSYCLFDRDQVFEFEEKYGCPPKFEESSTSTDTEAQAEKEPAAIDTEAQAEHGPASKERTDVNDGQANNIFRKIDDHWEIKYEGKKINLPLKSKGKRLEGGGLYYIVYLIGQYGEDPEKAISSLGFENLIEPRLGHGPYPEDIDDYYSSMSGEQLEDDGRNLSVPTGKQEDEAARKRIRGRIDRGITRIRKELPQLAGHLNESIDCLSRLWSYKPSTDMRWIIS